MKNHKLNTCINCWSNKRLLSKEKEEKGEDEWSVVDDLSRLKLVKSLPLAFYS